MSKHLIFIHPTVKNYDVLLQNLDINAEVTILKPDQDGIHQITEKLTNYRNIPAIHLVTHGDIGRLQFGRRSLETRNLGTYSTALQSWGKALATDGEVLLYGCNVARTRVGQSFVQQLSQLIGANVAASQQLVGNTQLGGSWNLSYQIGQIRTPLAFNLFAQQTYQYVLQDFQVTRDTDDGTGETEGTLSWAIRQANQIGGEDTITLTTDVRLNLAADLKRMQALIDSNITFIGNNFTICGDNDGDNVLDLNGEDRPIFFVQSGNVVFQDLTLTNGVARGGESDAGGAGAGLGGALFITNGNVTVDNVFFRNNRAVGGNSNEGGYGGGGFGGDVIGLGGGSLFRSNASINGGAGYDGSIASGNPSGNGENGNFGGGGGAGFNYGGNASGGNGGFGGGGGAGISDTVNGIGGDGGFGGGVGYGYTTGGDGGFGAGGGASPGTPGQGGFGANDGNGYAGGAGAGLGGAIFISGGSLNVLNSTFRRNEAIAGEGRDGASTDDDAQGIGGAIFATDSSSNPGEPAPTVLLQAVELDNNTDTNPGVDSDDFFGDTVDTNAPPEITTNNLRLDLPENVTNGTPLEESVVATDPDGDVLIYSITAGNEDGIFAISNAGEITVVDNATLDFDIEPDSYNLTVEVSDGGLTASTEVIVNLEDVNEAPTGINLSNAAINENSGDRTVIGEFTVEDPDVNPRNREVSYQLDLASQATFEIVRNELRVRNSDALDFETTTQFSITVTATDDDDLSTEQDFTIALNDVDEPPTDISLNNLNLNENTEGAVVGTLSANDPEGDASVFSVSDNRFEVVGTQLQLAAGQTVDFETESEIDLTITAVDPDLPGEGFSQDFTLTVNNLNEPPSSIALDPTNVEENVLGATIGTLTTTDPDGDTVFNYIVDDPRFEVINDELRLVANQSLDAEAAEPVEIQITATDNGSPAQSFTQGFTIAVDSVNEAPTGINLSNTAVDENAANATVIGQFTVEDPDVAPADRRVNYELDPVSDTIFRVTNDGELLVRDSSALDFETTTQFTVAVTAVDRNDDTLRSPTQTFVITLNDVNEPPTAISIDNTNVDENTPEAIVGTLTTLDPENGAIEYAVSDPRFEVVDDQLRVIAPSEGEEATVLDFETEPQITLEITAIDDGDPGLTFTETFVLDINPINEAPSEITLSNNTVDENVVAAVIGTLDSVDPEGDAVSYSTTDPRFVINGDQLQLAEGQSFNFEADVPDSGEPLTIPVTVTDEFGVSFTQDLDIVINDVDEDPTTILLDSTAVDENLAGAPVGLLSTDDPEGDLSDFVIDDPRFEAVRATDENGETITQLKLVDGTALDFEADPDPITIAITSTDRNGIVLTQNFTVTVNDINEPPTEISIDNLDVDENAENAVIGVFTALDPEGDGITFTFDDFTLEEGAEERFRIRQDGTLVLLPGQSLDFEDRSRVPLDVTATDDGDPSQSFTERFRVRVVDLNEAPPEITLDNDTVDENAAGAVIGNLSAADPEGGVLTFTVSDDRFEIGTGANGEVQLKLRPDASINFEQESEVTLSVTATDDSAEQLSLTQSFTISINDLNEAPSEISLDSQTIREGELGATVGILSSDDPEGDVITYTVDNPSFEVVGDLLKLTDDEALDFEQGSQVTLEVTATDGQEPLVTISQSFIITVDNLSEAGPDAPDFTSNPVTTINQGSLYTYEIAARDFDGDTIGINGPIIPDWLTLTNTGNGTARLTGTPDAEDIGSNAVRIRVSDGQFESFQDFTILVNEFNADAPSFTSAPVTSVNQGSNYTYVIQATDPNGDDLTITNLLGLPDWLNITDNGDGTARLAGTPDISDIGSSLVRLQVTDGEFEAFQDFTVTVNPLGGNSGGGSTGGGSTGGGSTGGSTGGGSTGGGSTVGGSTDGGSTGNPVTRDGIVSTDLFDPATLIPEFTIPEIDTAELSSAALTFVATEFDDALGGDAEANIIFAFGGNDFLSSGDNDDILFANQGRDLIDAGAGDDEVFSGRDNDQAKGGPGNDLIYGDLGNDTIRGDDGSDTILGGMGADAIAGGAGNDTIYGGKDDDLIAGEEDDDLFFGDIGNDLANGDGGNDSMFGNLGADSFRGGDGNDTMYGGKDSDILVGEAGDDVLFGDLGDDILGGGDGNDSLEGGAGNDTLVGGQGNDTLVGGDDSDVFVIAMQYAPELIIDYEDGVDRLALTGGLAFSDLSITDNGNSTSIQLASDQTLLATLEGIAAASLDQSDFTTI
ncbi:MAG: DUF4347 domain-containing protein [Microcoleaceae cyanobacterium]